MRKFVFIDFSKYFEKSQLFSIAFASGACFAGLGARSANLGFGEGVFQFKHTKTV
jgi:hypothetical protein